MGGVLSVYRTVRQQDPHNQVPSILTLVLLAHLSRMKRFKIFQAYTQWNLVAFLFNYSFRLRWEAPLVCNSMAIMTCFNCAQVDARADLIIRSGLSPFYFLLGDFAVHTMPALVLISWCVRHKRRIKLQHGLLALLGQLHFAYSQAGNLDLGGIYVPHDGNAAWMSAVLAQSLTPFLVNVLIDGHWAQGAAIALAINAPALLKLLGLRRRINKHTIEADKQRRKAEADEDSRNGER